jgi:phosphatidate cytidylyltransferase
MAAISNFWQRIITGAIFLLIMIGSIVLSFQSFLLIFGIVVILATREYLKIVSIFSFPNKLLVYIANITGYFLIALILMYDDSWLSNPTPAFRVIKFFITSRLLVFLTLLFPVLIITAEIFRKKEKSVENIAYSVLGFIYIAIPFMLLVQTFNPVIGNYNFRGPLAYFLLLWSTDSFAYVWGKLLGKHKLAPSVSAGKTIEGTIGGILTTMGFAVALYYIFPSLGYSITQWIIYGGLIALFAVPSDLSESLLKRKAGLKDSGNILPGHGGILDRFDSVLLTAPVVYIYITIINNIA